MTRIRLAEREDIPAMVAMGAAMVAESSFAPLGYDPERVAQHLQQVIDTGLAALSVEGEKVTGMLLGDIVVPWFARHRMGTERVLYVRPEYRGTRAAPMLIKAWVIWCKREGAVQIRPGTAADSPAADRLYRAMGFRAVGQVYVMDGS